MDHLLSREKGDKDKVSLSVFLAKLFASINFFDSTLFVLFSFERFILSYQWAYSSAG